MTSAFTIRPLRGPEAWSAAGARTKLVLSDYCILAGLCLALFFVADPEAWRSSRHGFARHLPLGLFMAGVVLLNLGDRLFPALGAIEDRRRWRVLAIAWPLLLLGIWIIIGSLYARNFLGIRNTFLTAGLNMLVVLMIARVVMVSQARERLIRFFMAAASLTALVMIAGMLIQTAGIVGFKIDYHVMEAQVMPIAVYFALLPMRSHGGRMVLVLLFLAAGLLFHKNTAYIVMAITLAYLWLTHWRHRFRDNRIFRHTTAQWAIVALIGVAAATAHLASREGPFMPSGNPEYRLLTYERAWNRFLDSPLWGTAFTAPGSEKFKAYDIEVAGGVLPTHSDILDLAAHGGSLGLLLWALAYLRIGRLAWREVLKEPARDHLSAAAHTLACMSLASIAVYAFNPVILDPSRSLLLWGQLGLLLGIALYRQAARRTP